MDVQRTRMGVAEGLALGVPKGLHEATRAGDGEGAAFQLRQEAEDGAHRRWRADRCDRQIQGA